MPLYRTGILAFALMGLIAGCAAGRTAIGKGEMLERQGRLDEAVLKYAEAAAANPNQGEYRLRFLKVSVDAARAHAKKGDEFLAQKNFDEAIREYQSAVALDPSFDKAKQQSDLLIKLRNAQVFFLEGVSLEKDNKPREALRAYQKAISIDSGHNGAKEGIERLLKTRKTKLDGYELNLKSTKPITLKFKDAKIKEVFNIITQLSGINFVFDEGVKDNNVTIYLENATFQQALDIITGINKLGKKALNEGTVIVFPKSPDKIKQYEELFVQTFYLNKLDAKKAVNLIRTMLQVKKIYVNEEMNALVIRDTPDVLDVARKILEANDVPDAEVLLEVEVIEIAKKNADNFGLVLSRYAVSAAASASGSGVFLPDVLTKPTTTTSTATPATGGAAATSTATTAMLNLFRWRGYDGFITVPNATFNFGKTIGNGETLSNPKIRVKNREKSKFNVGTRVPITTTSTNGTVGGINVNVQYVDVGVKLSAEPTIQLNNEVNIKLSLEVSSILSKDKVGDGNTTVVTIGTRNLDTVLSLKDGETSIIGGLMQDIKSKSNQKISLLGDIPVLGSLFSSHDTSNDKTELILAITPRIVRGITVPEADVAAFWSGMEDDPSIAKPYGSFTQEPEFAVTPQPTAAPFPKPVPPQTQPAAPAPFQPVLEPQQKVPAQPGTTPVTAVPAAPMPAAQTLVPSPAPPPVRQPAERISLNIGAPASVKAGEQFMAEIKISDAKSLLNAPFVLVYDPAFLEFQAAAEGDFLNRDGKSTTFKSTVDKNTGQVTITSARQPGDGGIGGAGTLLTASFKAKSKGPASLGFMSVKFTDAGGKIIETIPYNTVIEIK